MSVHDRWAGARTGKGRRWETRWRAAGQQHKRRFDTRQAAEAWDAKQRIAPEARLAREGRTLTVEAMMATWLATKAGLAPNSVDAYTYAAREVYVRFGDRLASGLRVSEIQAWSGRSRGTAVRRKSLAALSGAYKMAVADGLLTLNPCAGIPMPRGDTAEARFLLWSELAQVAEKVGPHWSALVWLMGTSGLRIGEAAGLQVGDVGKARVRVARAVSRSSRGVEVRSTKSRKGRDVPVPPFVLEMLATDRSAGEWLFTGINGGRVNVGNWRRRVFQPAARAAGLGELNPHALRHTAASLAIAAGADVLAVQRMLGHASATTTLRLYAHLFDQRLDDIALRMQEARVVEGLAALEQYAQGAAGAHEAPESAEKAPTDGHSD